MKTITTRTINAHTFEIVESIPSNFLVWNIGKNMGTDDYIPLCELLDPANKKSGSINQDTLKAIKLEKNEVALLRDAAHWGVNNLATAKKALKSKRKGYFSNNKREQAEKTIAIFERISK